MKEEEKKEKKKSYTILLKLQELSKAKINSKIENRSLNNYLENCIMEYNKKYEETENKN